jgi:hypothetical protein
LSLFFQGQTQEGEHPTQQTYQPNQQLFGSLLPIAPALPQRNHQLLQQSLLQGWLQGDDGGAGSRYLRHLMLVLFKEVPVLLPAYKSFLDGVIPLLLIHDGFLQLLYLPFLLLQALLHDHRAAHGCSFWSDHSRAERNSFVLSGEGALQLVESVTGLADFIEGIVIFLFLPHFNNTINQRIMDMDEDACQNHGPLR